jgi:hypothetical protein
MNTSCTMVRRYAHARVRKGTSAAQSTGMRHVPPYKFEFEAFVRRRWVGRTVWEIMFADFPYYPEECVSPLRP